MFQQLRRQVRRQKRLRALALLAAGLLLLAFHLPGLRLLAGGPADLYALDAGSLEGRYVAARVDIIYDWYAETVQQNRGGEHRLRREYIIPVGRSEYMGMDLPAAQLPAAEAVLASTGAVLHGSAEALDGSSVLVRGTVLPMDSQTKAYFATVAGIENLTAADQARFLPLVLVSGRVGAYTETQLYLALAGGAALLLAGLAALAWAGSRPGPIQPSAYLRAIAGPMAPRLEREELDEFYRQTGPVGRLRANNRWLLCQDAAASWLLYSRDVAWVYRTRRNIVVCARSPQGRRLRGRYRIPVRGHAEANAVLERLYPLLPDAVFGYRPEWELLYQANPARFCREIRAEQQARREAAARQAAASPPAAPGGEGEPAP